MADRVQRSYWMPTAMATDIEAEAARRSVVEGRKVHNWEIVVEQLGRSGIAGAPQRVVDERVAAVAAAERLKLFLISVAAATENREAVKVPDPQGLVIDIESVLRALKGNPRP